MTQKYQYNYSIRGPANSLTKTPSPTVTDYQTSAHRWGLTILTRATAHTQDVASHTSSKDSRDAWSSLALSTGGGDLSGSGRESPHDGTNAPGETHRRVVPLDVDVVELVVFLAS